MFILTRKIGQKIRIPNREVVIKIVEIKANCVRIGINAPQATRILRGELLQKNNDAQDSLSQPIEA